MSLQDEYNSIGISRVSHLKKLNYIQSFEIQIERPKLAVQTKYLDENLAPEVETGKWRASSCSIIQYHGYYLVNCRMVNYHQEGHYFTPMEEDNIIRTRNYLILLDKDFQSIMTSELSDLTEKVRYIHHIRGIEDVRICMLPTHIDNTTKDTEETDIYVDFMSGITQNDFKDNISCWSERSHVGFTCVTYDNYPNMCIPRISVGSFRPEFPYETYISNIKEMVIKPAITVEKNWMPFVSHNHLKLIYSFNPLTIIDVDSNSKTEIDISDLCSDVKDFRGGAGPIVYKQGEEFGLLCVIHHVIDVIGKSRLYLHRFVWISPKYSIKVSNSFYLENINVEFCLGLSHRFDSNSVLLCAGIRERRPMCYEISCEVIDEMLQFLDTTKRTNINDNNSLTTIVENK